MFPIFNVAPTLPDMPESSIYTACSCAHGKAKSSTQPHQDLSPKAVAANHTKALSEALLAHRRRTDQCRARASVVAEAARDATWGTAGSLASSSSTPNSPCQTTPSTNNSTDMADHMAPLGNNTLPVSPAAFAQLSRLHFDSNTPSLASPTKSSYPPTAPAKWYDDPIADARCSGVASARSAPATPILRPTLGMTCGVKRPSSSQTAAGDSGAARKRRASGPASTSARPMLAAPRPFAPLNAAVGTKRSPEGSASALE